MEAPADNSVLENLGLVAAIPEKRSGAWPRTRAFRSAATTSAIRGQLLALAAIGCLGGCTPNIVVGQYKCPASTADGGAVPAAGDPIAIPWSTGFEDQTCGYEQAGGFCFNTGPASFRTVASPPPHGGSYSEAFNATGDDKNNAGQVRCVRQGVLPPTAYYGAWYFISATATNTGLWNLFHFLGADSPTAAAHSLWDVSLVNGADGALNVRVLDFLWTGSPGGNVADAPLAAPIGAWFHLEFFFKRAKDGTGDVALYQNGVRVVHYANVITDDTNWGQWYVGNLADALDPPDSTLYVDDVTIAATRGYTPPP